MRFLFIVLFSVALSASGQYVFPTYGDSVSWTVLHWQDYEIPNGGFGTYAKSYRVHMISDTVFCGYKYSTTEVIRDFDSTYFYKVYTRSDSQKVYYRNRSKYTAFNNVDCAKPEILGYDFSLNSGDTVRIEFIGSTPSNGFYVDSTKIETVFGANRKVLYLSCYTGQPTDQTWYSGYGSTTHPFYFVRQIGTADHSGWHLSCVDSMNTFMPCDTTYDTSIGISTFNKKEFNLFPNPTTGKFAIEFDSSIPELTLSIFSSQGQLISKETHFSKSTIQTEIKGELGLYFVEIQTDQKPGQVFKILKQ